MKLKKIITLLLCVVLALSCCSVSCFAAQTKIYGENIKFDSGKVSFDISVSGNPGIMEYRGVDVMTGAELFRQGPFQDATNNIGEFLALVHALAFFHNTGNNHTAIYSDSRTAQAWVRDRKCKSKLERTDHNERVFELIGRAERWLATHTWQNRIIKWETDKWGEIPADFGRK